MSDDPTPDTVVPRLVVVDDTDPTIRYSGAFSPDSTGMLDTQGYGGPVFNRTITGTKTNASLSYNFKGSFVRAMVAATGLYSWNCSVDNQLIFSFTVNTSQVTNYIACDSAGILADSTNEHTLNVNFFFPTESPPNSSLWLDSIQYQPLPSDPLDAVTLRVHNSDPSVSYSNSSGGWTYQGFGSNGTDIAGTSVTFNFKGTSVSLYTVNFGYPTDYNSAAAIYNIDGSVTDFDLPASTTVASISSQLANILNWRLFSVSNLTPSTHSLEVIGSFVSAKPNYQWLNINYFLIKTNPVSSLSPGGSSNSTRNPGSSSSPSSGQSSSNSTPVGAIVGGVVGGVVGIAAIILIIFFVRKRKRNVQYQGGMLNQSDGISPSASNSGSPMYSTVPSAPSPYSGSSLLSPGSSRPPPLLHENYPYIDSARENTARMIQLHPNMTPVLPSSHSPNFDEFSPISLYEHNQGSDSPITGSGSPTGLRRSGFDPSRLVAMKNAQSNAVREDQPRNTEVRLHADSGIRFTLSDEREVIDVPPTYTDT